MVHVQLGCYYQDAIISCCTVFLHFQATWWFHVAHAVLYGSSFQTVCMINRWFMFNKSNVFGPTCWCSKWVKPLVVQWSGNTYYQEFRMPSSVVAQTGVFPWSLCSGLTIHHPSLFTCHQFTCFALRSKGPHLSACLQSWEAVYGLSSSHWNDTRYSCTHRDRCWIVEWD